MRIIGQERSDAKSVREKAHEDAGRVWRENWL